MFVEECDEMFCDEMFVEDVVMKLLKSDEASIINISTIDESLL